MFLDSCICMQGLLQHADWIDPDRQRHSDILVDTKQSLAGFVPRHIGLLPSELSRQVDLAQPGVLPRLREQADDAGMQVGQDRAGGHGSSFSQLVQYT
jgi:hypothetical protein